MYSCIKIYPRGEHVYALYELTTQVDDWIKFNKKYFPHCALFVNGECRFNGNFSDEKCKELMLTL
jgi:hypothetical protein